MSELTFYARKIAHAAGYAATARPVGVGVGG